MHFTLRSVVIYEVDVLVIASPLRGIAEQSNGISSSVILVVSVGERRGCTPVPFIMDFDVNSRPYLRYCMNPELQSTQHDTFPINNCERSSQRERLNNPC